MKVGKVSAQPQLSGMSSLSVSSALTGHRRARSLLAVENTEVVEVDLVRYRAGQASVGISPRIHHVGLVVAVWKPKGVTHLMNVDCEGFLVGLFIR